MKRMKRNNKGSSELIVIILSIVIFAAVGTFFVSTSLGHKTNSSGSGTGISGASERVNTTIINSMP